SIFPPAWMWRLRLSGKNINRPCGDSRPRLSGGARLRMFFAGEGARATQENKNGKGSRNSGEKSRDDAAFRFERRSASGHRAAGGAMRGHSTQVTDERWLRLGPDRPGGICEGIAPDAAHARTSGEEQCSAGEIHPRSSD